MLAINIVVSTQQYFYQGFTLIDITPTGITSYSAEHEFERNQQRNWETVLQCISLRAQPLHIREPELMEVDNVGLLGKSV